MSFLAVGAFSWLSIILWESSVQCTIGHGVSVEIAAQDRSLECFDPWFVLIQVREVKG